MILNILTAFETILANVTEYNKCETIPSNWDTFSQRWDNPNPHEIISSDLFLERYDHDCSGIPLAESADFWRSNSTS